MVDLKPCVNGIPCTQQWIDWFGFITIPFLSFVAFTLITILMFMIGKGEDKHL
jgi:disulfide bond formation protein DsbB